MALRVSVNKIQAVQAGVEASDGRSAVASTVCTNPTSSNAWDRYLPHTTWAVAGPSASSSGVSLAFAGPTTSLLLLPCEPIDVAYQSRANHANGSTHQPLQRILENARFLLAFDILRYPFVDGHGRPDEKGRLPGRWLGAKRWP